MDFLQSVSTKTREAHTQPPNDLQPFPFQKLEVYVQARDVVQHLLDELEPLTHGKRADVRSFGVSAMAADDTAAAASGLLDLFE